MPEQTGGTILDTAVGGGDDDVVPDLLPGRAGGGGTVPLDEDLAAGDGGRIGGMTRLIDLSPQGDEQRPGGREQEHREEDTDQDGAGRATTGTRAAVGGRRPPREPHRIPLPRGGPERRTGVSDTSVPETNVPRTTDMCDRIIRRWHH